MRKLKNPDPKLTAAARAILKAKIRVHPEAAKYVRSSEAVSKLRKSELLSIAQKLGIDVGDVVRQAEMAPKATGFEIELAADEAEGHAFSGEIEFDLEVKLLGTAFQRQAKVIYQHTPEWTYLSPVTGTERLGSGRSSFEIQILAILEKDVWVSKDGKVVKRKNEPYWTHVEGIQQDGVLPESVVDTIFALIDDHARQQDAANRDKRRDQQEGIHIVQ